MSAFCEDKDNVTVIVETTMLSVIDTSPRIDSVEQLAHAEKNSSTRAPKTSEDDFPFDSVRHICAFVSFILLVCGMDLLLCPNSLVCGSYSNMLCLVFLYNMDMCVSFGYYAVVAGFNALLVALCGIFTYAQAIGKLKDADPNLLPENLKEKILEMVLARFGKDAVDGMDDVKLFSEFVDLGYDELKRHVVVIIVTTLLIIVYLLDRAVKMEAKRREEEDKAFEILNSTIEKRMTSYDMVNSDFSDVDSQITACDMV